MDNLRRPFQTQAEFLDAHERLMAHLDDASDPAQPQIHERLIAMLDEVRDFMQQGRDGGAYLHEPKERRACQALLDYWSSQCYSSGLDIQRALLAPHDASLMPTLADEACPYVGLDAFGETDARHFFGRDDQVAGIVERLEEGRLVVVTGASGSGKSSLVLAGLVPTLRRGALEGSAQWRYLPPLVPGTAPLQHLAHSLADAALPAGADRTAWVEAQAEAMLADASHAARLLDGDATPALIVIDQFEEALTLRSAQSSDAYAAFVANLRSLLEWPAPAHRLILTMRKDVEPQLAREYPDLNRLYGPAAFPVYSMDSARLRDTIERPAQQVGLRFQEGVVDELIKSVVGEDAGLPLLQFSLMALWERRKGNLVTHEAYREVGSPRQAMAEAAGRLYAALPREQQLAAQKVFIALSRQGEGATVFRNRASRRLLYGVADAPNVDAVLAKFAQARLVRVTRIDAEPLNDVAEVAHESLLRNWELLDRLFAEQRVERERRAFLRKQAEKWREGGFDQAFVLSGLALQQANDEFDRAAITALEREFLEASDQAEAARERAHAEEEERRIAVEVERVKVAEQRANVERHAADVARELARESDQARRKIARRLLGATIAALVAVVLAGIAANEWLSVQSALKEAEARSLGLKAASLASTNSDLSVLLAAEAVRREPSLIDKMVPVVLDATRFRTPSKVLPAALVGEVEALAMSASGDRLLVARRDGIDEWSLRQQPAAKLRRLAWDRQPEEVRFVAYAPDGAVIAATDLGLAYWASGAGEVAKRIEGDGQFDRLSFNTNGTLVAAVSSDGDQVHAWSLPSGRQVLAHAPSGADSNLYDAVFSTDASRLHAIASPRGEAARVSVYTYRVDGAHIAAAASTASAASCSDLDPAYAAGGTSAGIGIKPHLCMINLQSLARDGSSLGPGTPIEVDAAIDDIVFSRDGRFVVKLRSKANEAEVADLESGTAWRLQGAFDLTPSSTYEAFIGISKRGEWLAIKARDGAIRLFELAGRPRPLTDRVDPVWVSRDDRRAMFAVQNVGGPSFELRDLDSGALLHQLDREGRYAELTNISITEDGRFLAAIGQRKGSERRELVSFDLERAGSRVIEQPIERDFGRRGGLRWVGHEGRMLLYTASSSTPIYTAAWQGAGSRRPSRDAPVRRSEAASNTPYLADAIALGNAGLFAHATVQPGGVRVEILAIKDQAAQVTRTIERPFNGRVSMKFSGNARALLLADEQKTEVWDLASASKSPAVVPAFVLAATSPENIRVHAQSGLVASRRANQPWELRRLDGDGAALATLPAAFDIDKSVTYAWGPSASGRGIEVRTLAEPQEALLRLDGDSLSPEFSARGGVMAVRFRREGVLRIYRLPSPAPVLETSLARFGAFELTDAGRYIKDNDRRLIPTDAKGIMEMAQSQISRKLDDADRCRVLEDASACARERRAGREPTATVASTSH